MEKRAFVTGGSGFIGSHLVEHLKASGYTEIRCLVRSSPKWLADIDGITLVRGSLFDTDVLEQALEGVDYVYHLAGVTRAPRPEVYYQGNVEATLRLLDTVQRVNPHLSRILITSSLAAVGPSPDDQPLTEETLLRPISTYGKSKAQMEQQVRPYHDVLPITIVRPPAVYGPRERDIYTFFRVVKRGLCPIIGDHRRPRLSLIHVTDLVQGIQKAAEVPRARGQTYFLGSETYYTWPHIRDAVLQALGTRAWTIRIPPSLVVLTGTVVEMAGRLMGHYPPLNREKAREMIASWMCSVEKARNELNFRQTISLEEGIRQTVSWYQEHGWL